MTHVPPALIASYAQGLSTGIDAAVIEAHLGTCASCRSKLHVPDKVLDEVWGEIDLGATRPRGSVWVRAAVWASPAMVPWIAMTVLVTAVTVVTDLLGTQLLVLLAPIAPVAGVAAAWSRGMDPAHEIVACTPRAGLDLVLRRTIAVLAVLLPVLLPLGWLIGASPAQWLLPCLAFTTATLALGTLIGVRRAAVGLATTWVAFVVGPSLVAASLPALLAPSSAGLWLIACAVAAVVVVLRASAFTRLASGN
ncbi:hypothetical protein JOD54_002684 [Actinokineospora baliensis]|uniref:zf-HC2 domain-containing protein n=1 Tax=Actinokineospora baliensis TaxID=547056 RepID=UPI001957A35D|nr:zf-HC2 domain-containing protein [Actinokineospora baliensis]MBM7772480.1 hypothetical protein [Actinokineospora baliensis]